MWLAERRAKFVTTLVAVKLPLDEQVDHAAIEQEARLWAQASGHSNVLPIIEANEYDGQIVIVSEYAPDGSLEELLRTSGGALPVKQAVELTIGILKGLEFLHSRKIIHRDIKPGNILLQGDTPRVADFGISRAMRTISTTLTIAGTPQYMSPEAFNRKRNAQTDIWSVGVVIYQMLAGSLPFPQENYGELINAILNREPAPLLNSIPSKLQKIVLKALSKTQATRYQTAREMLEELNKFQAWLSQPVAAQIKKTAALKKGEDKTTVKVSVSPPGFSKQPYEIADKLLIPFRKGKKFGFGYAAKFLYIKAKYHDADCFSEGLAPVSLNGRWGFIDKAGKEIIPIIYDAAGTFADGLAYVKLNGKAGFIDKTGKVIIPIKYDEASTFSEELACVSLNGKWSFIDKRGKKIIPVKYEYAESFSEGLASVFLEDKYGFIDKRGEEVIPLKYDVAYWFSEGLACVKLNGKWSFIDKTGKEVLPLKYDMGSFFSEGLASVSLNGKYGFIDKRGKEIIPIKYYSADGFSEGLACVKLNDKYGFIDKKGKEIIPINYDLALPFNEGLAYVQLNDKGFYIDKSGKEYYEP